MNFTDALNRNLEDIKRPPNLPVGHYVWQINRVPEQEAFTSRNTGDTFDRLTFQVVCVEPMDDVDADELEEYGNVQGTPNRKSFLFTQNEEEAVKFEQSMNNLKRFLGHCGLEEGNVEAAINDCVGKQFVGELGHRPDPNDPEVIYAEIGRTAKV